MGMCEALGLFLLFHFSSFIKKKKIIFFMHYILITVSLPVLFPIPPHLSSFSDLLPFCLKRHLKDHNQT